MKTVKVKPSDLREWDDVKDQPHYEHKNAELYGWYWDAYHKKWFPHRKPSLTESENNKFK